MSTPEKRFKVALSFAGELRPFVEQVASGLAARLGQDHVLYDKYYEAEFARPNLDIYLQQLYQKEANLIAVFINADYKRKPWPGLEWRVVRVLISGGQGPAIMVFRFDNTEIPGLLPSDGYVFIGERSASDVANLIIQRLSIDSDLPSRQSLARPIESPKTWLVALKDLLVADFVETEGNFQGHFYCSGTPEAAKRWQSPGGELTDHPTIFKRPYYETYWGYRAAIRIAPEYVEKWRPITVQAIRRHFGDNRWLQVMRDYSFSRGPTAKPRFAESVRHTARAAALLYMLQSDNPKVSETAWELVSKSKNLQRSDGGWIEFRGTNESSSLWSTVYIFQFLSALVNSQLGIPDEREQFLEKAKVLLEKTELFLIESWQKNRWTDDPELPWPEVTAVVFPEVAQFLRDRAFVKNCYDALRELVNPSGQLEMEGISLGAGAPTERIQALGLAFALKAAGRELYEGDSRYHRLSQWVTEHLELSELSAHDVAFAVEVIDLNAAVPA